MVRVEARSSCELLEWDSEHFGFPIARVLGSTLDQDSAAMIDEWCESQGVRCLYFLADAADDGTARQALDSGYTPLEVRLTMRHDLDRLPAEGRAVEIREAIERDIPILRELAARSHHDSRFYQDPGFSSERCDALYATWVENGIRDPGRRVLAPVVNGGPVGYQVMSPAPGGGLARLKLLAVDDAHRGRGLGRAVLAFALRRAQSDGASAVETVIRERNTRALRAHRAVGFSEVHRRTFNHKWYPR